MFGRPLDMIDFKRKPIVVRVGHMRRTLNSCNSLHALICFFVWFLFRGVVPYVSCAVALCVFLYYQHVVVGCLYN